MRKLKPGSPFLPRPSNDFKPAVPFQGKRAHAPKAAGLKAALGHRDGARALRRTRLASPPAVEAKHPQRYLHASRTQA